MTILFNSEKKCSICGEVSSHYEVGSTNRFGSPDLDTRPPEMERSNIGALILTCPKCGYCAPDLSITTNNSLKVIKGEVYNRQYFSDEYPKLANNFLCYSIIQESAGKYVKAMWASIHAAWICDDEGNNIGAIKCRERAVELYQKAKKYGNRINIKTGFQETLLADLLRRSGQFEKALHICELGLTRKSESIISKILQFQKILIVRSDVACYTVADAVGNE
jgi:hypothetical protein